MRGRRIESGHDQAPHIYGCGGAATRGAAIHCAANHAASSGSEAEGEDQRARQLQSRARHGALSRPLLRELHRSNLIPAPGRAPQRETRRRTQARPRCRPRVDHKRTGWRSTGAPPLHRSLAASAREDHARRRGRGVAHQRRSHRFLGQHGGSTPRRQASALKEALERTAAAEGRSEAEIVRSALAAATSGHACPPWALLRARASSKRSSEAHTPSSLLRAHLRVVVDVGS